MNQAIRAPLGASQMPSELLSFIPGKRRKFTPALVSRSKTRPTVGQEDNPVVVSDSPHLVLFPAAAVAGAVLGFNFLGDALRDRLDPRTRLELGL